MVLSAQPTNSNPTWSRIALVLVSAFLATRALDLGSCRAPLGLESGQIADSAISASSSYDAGNVGPQFARLRHDRNGGAWCPKQQVMRGIKEWIEVDLKRLHCLTAVQTQGRFGNGQGQEYVEEFKIEYWRPGMERWIKYRDRTGSEILAGNTNTYTVAENRLEPVVIATKIRLIPYSLHRRTVCLRMELFGCPFQEGVVSYSSPQGDVLDDIDLVDDMYDGIADNGFLKGGLGQLMDGRIGHSNIDVDVSQHGPGYEWVGWRNKTDASTMLTSSTVKRANTGRQLEMVFEFDSVRNFSHMDIYTSNDFRRGVQVFSRLRVFFSIGGRRFVDDNTVDYVYMADLNLDQSRNVSVHLRHRVARYLKLQFEFASRWILISEIYFQSEPAEGNFSEEVRAAGSPLSDANENHLQRDTVVNLKPADEHNVAMATEEVTSSGTSPTGVVIGVMTFIIVVLVAAIVAMSVRNNNCHQNGRSSILPASFASVTLKDIALGLKSTSLDADFDAAYNNSISLQNYTMEPLYASVQNAPGEHLSKATAIYNEPFGHQDVLYAVANKTVQVNKCKDDDGHSLYATADLVAETPDSVASDRPWKSSISSERIQFVQRFMANGSFGQVDLCRLVCDEDGQSVHVLVKSFPTHYSSLEMAEECRVLVNLRHDNLLSMLGLTDGRTEPLLVIEYGSVSDLCQFLQDHVAETSPINGPILSYGCLIYMAKQIAAAMEHLEIHNIVHRDVATRNCVVGAKYSVKIATFGFNSDLYAGDYFQVDSQLLPIRWMAWESLTLGQYSSRSDVWSFAVLLWEVLSYAREQPLEQLSDEDVLHLLMNYSTNTHSSHQVQLLAKPILCPKEIYDLMCECWQIGANDRPTFREIHMFLSRKNLGYDPESS